MNEQCWWFFSTASLSLRLFRRQSIYIIALGLINYASFFFAIVCFRYSHSQKKPRHKINFSSFSRRAHTKKGSETFDFQKPILMIKFILCFLCNASSSANSLRKAFQLSLCIFHFVECSDVKWHSFLYHLCNVIFFCRTSSEDETHTQKRENSDWSA